MRALKTFGLSLLVLGLLPVAVLTMLAVVALEQRLRSPHEPPADWRNAGAC